MVDYVQYSGFLVPAKEFDGMVGYKYANGWVVGRHTYEPWYLKAKLDSMHPLETEMGAFHEHATTEETTTPIIPNDLKAQLLTVFGVINYGQVAFLNVLAGISQ